MPLIIIDSNRVRLATHIFRKKQLIISSCITNFHASVAELVSLPDKFKQLANSKSSKKLTTLSY